MDQDEIVRKQCEENLEQIGQEFGMADSRSMASTLETWAGYETREGAVHYFTFAPVGSDVVLPF